MTILIGKILTGAVAIALLIGVVLSLSVRDLGVGSVSLNSEYFATSTAADAAYGAGTNTELLVQTGPGVFGSFIITGVDTGVVNFYDATTTVAGNRVKATSTILLASFPASMATGTYVIDARFNDGLLMFVETGTLPTTTITWRRQ